jgi:hypothetical protein
MSYSVMTGTRFLLAELKPSGNSILQHKAYSLNSLTATTTLRHSDRFQTQHTVCPRWQPEVKWCSIRRGIMPTLGTGFRGTWTITKIGRIFGLRIGVPFGVIRAHVLITAIIGSDRIGIKWSASRTFRLIRTVATRTTETTGILGNKIVARNRVENLGNSLLSSAPLHWMWPGACTSHDKKRRQGEEETHWSWLFD